MHPGWRHRDDRNERKGWSERDESERDRERERWMEERGERWGSDRGSERWEMADPARRGAYGGSYGGGFGGGFYGGEQRGFGGERDWGDRGSGERSWGERGWGGQASFGGGQSGYGSGQHGWGDWREGRRGMSGRMGEHYRSRFRGPRSYTRSDERIREDVYELLSQGYIDAYEIEVTVQGGDVTLSGNVSDRRDKRIAEELAEHVTGVKDIDNRIKVRPEGEPREPTRRNQPSS